MAGELILATDQGVVVCEAGGPEWQVIRRGLEVESATSVIAREGVILAGTRRGIFRSDDLGRTWLPTQNGLGKAIVRWLAYHPGISDFELAGVEPAGIYLSRDGGEHWSGSPAVDELRRRLGWYLPYSPEAGCVRGFAIHGSRIYAAVEVGGVLRSDDYGQTWALVNGGSAGSGSNVHPDVHSIVISPVDGDRIYTPTGGGFYTSRNGGSSWQVLVPDCYCRAMWLDPANPERMLLGIAEGVDRNGRIASSEDGGRSWQPAVDGLQVPWVHHMVERFAQAGKWLLAILSNGGVLQAEIPPISQPWSWEPVLEAVKYVRAASLMSQVSGKFE